MQSSPAVRHLYPAASGTTVFCLLDRNSSGWVKNQEDYIWVAVLSPPAASHTFLMQPAGARGLQTCDRRVSSHGHRSRGRFLLAAYLSCLCHTPADV